MNHSSLKTFAPAVRLQLIEAVTRKLDFVLTADTADLRAMRAQRESLRRESERDRKGLIERVAYTWFNRFTALRFLDAHRWHPFGARVITAATAEETLPELLQLVRSGQLPAELGGYTDPVRLSRLLDGVLPSKDPQSEVYRHLVLAACRFYHTLLPNIFERLDDETELLLPDDLLTERSIVHGFRTEIADADCTEVEIIGWLYQFYISERKDQVMARKSAVPTEDIPAVTQLFTPHWIVRYLVENSLGRLWLLNRPRSKLRGHMPYYLEGEADADFLKITKAEDIRICDPAVGSGHMLTYAFDLLTLIYEEEGYAPTEIPSLILRHNLTGLEICPRAAQLAELALVFKAREKSRRFFLPGHLVRPHIIALRDVQFAENELRDYIRALGLGDLFNRPVLQLLHQFEEARNFGSLIQPCLGETEIHDLRVIIEAKDIGDQLFLRETHLKVLRVFEQSEALAQRHHVVAANPPYMGSSAMNPGLKAFLASSYDEGRADLYAAFILRNLSLVNHGGLVGMITIPNWMFLQSFEELRIHLLATSYLSSMVHNGRGVWGGDFGSCSFIFVKAHGNQRNGIFKRLYIKQGEIQSNAQIEANFRNTSEYPSYKACSLDFARIPGSPIAYWITPKVAGAFSRLGRLSEVGDTRIGLITGENQTYIRFWHEVANAAIGFSLSRDEANVSGKRWFPQSKGGNFRRWFGNNETVVDWRADGATLQTRLHESGERTLAHNFNLDRIFQPALTWTKVTAGKFSARLQPPGFLFNDASANLFVDADSTRLHALAFLNSILCPKFLEALNPTLNFLPGNVSALPFPTTFEMGVAARASEIASLCVDLSRADWDNFETSWDFRDHPMLRSSSKGATLEASWRNWETRSAAAIRRMQELETENNRLFISAYGLDGEFPPEVSDTEITLTRAEGRRDMAALLSYAVGCMMGRYSLDQPGLVIANPGDAVREFHSKVKVSQDKLTFSPSEDGIIPVLDGEWFEDDIVARIRDFLRAIFGEATLSENIRFIEELLGKDLRKYFQSEFYKNHLQTYKKRPIYWLFRSPKGGFGALVYLHRITRDTPNLILNRYLRDFLQKLRARIEQLEHAQVTAVTARERTIARKESDQLKKTLRECEEWERDVLLPLAQSRPDLDLDDGVKFNYLKLGEALAPIAGLATAEEE